MHRAALCHDLRAWAREADLNTLIERNGTPLLVLEPARAAMRYHALRNALPFVRCHYAVKTLDHPDVLASIAAVGGLFEVASPSEVAAVQNTGSDMSTCIYTHPIKRPGDIDDAYLRGIRTFVVDNATEIEKFLGRPNDIRLLLRLSFPNPEAKCDLSAKFGASPDQAIDLVQLASSKGIEINGLSFHVGSQTTSTQPYRAAITRCLELIDEVDAQLGRRLEVLDIGGGFPVAYRDSSCAADDIFDVIRELLAPHAHHLTIVAEPGRYVAASCMTLVTSVIGISVRQSRNWYYLDDGVYGAYSNVAWEDVHPPILALSELSEDPLRNTDPSARALRPCVLAGPTCDSVDVIATDYPMPALVVGDHVISPAMGAYTLVTACRFNGLPMPTVAAVTSCPSSNASSPNQSHGRSRSSVTVPCRRGRRGNI